MCKRNSERERQIEKEERYGIVYKVTNKLNGKVYIGITKNNFKQRYASGKKGGIGVERMLNTYLYAKEHGLDYNFHLLYSIQKYGTENFEVDEEFDIAYSKEELCQKEIYYIAEYKSNDPRFGYNNTTGGEGQFEMSELSSIRLQINRAIRKVYIDRYTKVLYKNGEDVRICKICGIKYCSGGTINYCKDCFDNKYHKFYNENKKIVELERDRLWKERYVEKEDEIINIPITKDEINYMNSCKKKYRKFILCLIAYGKYKYREYKAEVNKLGMLYSICNNSVTGKERNKTIEEMKSSGIINVDEEFFYLNIDVFNDEVAFYMDRLYDMWLQYEYYCGCLKIKKCEVCGEYINIKTNTQKYCKECSSNVAKIKRRLSSRRNKKNNFPV